MKKTEIAFSSAAARFLGHIVAPSAAAANEGWKSYLASGKKWGRNEGKKKNGEIKLCTYGLISDFGCDWGRSKKKK